MLYSGEFVDWFKDKWKKPPDSADYIDLMAQAFQAGRDFEKKRMVLFIISEGEHIIGDRNERRF